MKLSADKDALAALLTKAAGTVSNKDIQPILKNFLIKADGDTLRVMSTDMSLGALAEVNLTTIDEEGMVCAPARKLLEMVNSAPSGAVRMEMDDRVMNVFTSWKNKDDKKNPLPEPKFKNKWELHCEDGALYPEFPTFDEKKAVSCPRESMVKGMKRISFAAADNELKINLMAVYINGGFMYAADGHRACKLKYDTSLSDIMIPAPAVKMLISLLRDSQAKEIKIVKTKFHLLFSVGNDIYHTRLLEAKFPDIERRVFADTEKYEHELKLKRDELKAALRRAKVTASEETKQLSMIYADDGFSLTTENTIEDKYLEIFDFAEWTGDDFNRTVNWEYLEDVVNALSKDVVVIRLGDDKGARRSKFRIDEEDFAAVVLPLRVKKDAQGRVEKVHARIKEHTEAQEVAAELGASA